MGIVKQNVLEREVMPEKSSQSAVNNRKMKNKLAAIPGAIWLPTIVQITQARNSQITEPICLNHIGFRKEIFVQNNITRDTVSVLKRWKGIVMTLQDNRTCSA